MLLPSTVATGVEPGAGLGAVTEPTENFKKGLDQQRNTP